MSIINAIPQSGPDASTPTIPPFNCIRASGDFSVVVKDNILYTFGSNINGQLGRIGTSATSLIADIGTIPIIDFSKTTNRGVSISNYNAVAAWVDNTIYTWGLNTNNSLNRTAPTISGSNGTLTYNSNTGGFTVNQYRQNVDRISIPKKICVAASSRIMIVDEYSSWTDVASNNPIETGGIGAPYSWGDNTNGALHRSSSGNSLGNLGVIPAGTYTNVHTFVEVATGNSPHSIFITVAGLVFTVGNNSAGQLGRSGVSSATAAAAENFDKVADLRTVGTGVFVKAACNISDSVSAVIDTEGRIITFGANTYGSLGVSGATGGSSSNVTFWQPIYDPANRWIDISGGSYHFLGLRENGDVYGWGRNNYGQCGVTGGTTISVPTKLAWASNIVEISAGGNHNLIRDRNNVVYAFGLNSNGQLGVVRANDSSSSVTPNVVPI